MLKITSYDVRRRNLNRKKQAVKYRLNNTLTNKPLLSILIKIKVIEIVS